jgi:predicted ArsR family transcriptional regulator
MAQLGDRSATRTAKVLSLPTRAAILSLLLTSGPKTVKDIAQAFKIHPNVARAHLDLMVEAGFLACETRRQTKGRPAKVYFTWEGESGALAEAGVEVGARARRRAPRELEQELHVLERMLVDAVEQMSRIKELVEETPRAEEEESHG